MRGTRSEKQKTAAPRIALGRGKRDIDDAVAYPLADRSRVEIRAILNEGGRSRDELARLTNEPIGPLKWHLSEMLADGTIELGEPKRVGSGVKYCYRAVEVPRYSEEEIAAMPREARKALAGISLQASLAEALAAFWAGRMVPDPNVVLAWRWFNVDARGREAIANEQASSWARMQEMAADAIGRIKLGEPSSSILVSSFRYVRARFSSTPPLMVLDPMEGAIEVALRLGHGGRSAEEAVSYAISDKLRIEILTILNESVRDRYELANLIGETPDKIKHHLKELLNEGSIELAYSDRVGNAMHYYYRAVRMPRYSAEEYAALPPESRQAIVGVTLQCMIAEALAALRGGTMVEDPQFRLAWRRCHVDAQGRVEMGKEQERSWARMHEIEAEAIGRVAQSGEPTKSIIVNSLGFVRFRQPSLSGSAMGPDEFIVGGTDLGSLALLRSA